MEDYTVKDFVNEENPGIFEIMWTIDYLKGRLNDKLSKFDEKYLPITDLVSERLSINIDDVVEDNYENLSRDVQLTLTLLLDAVLDTVTHISNETIQSIMLHQMIAYELGADILRDVLVAEVSNKYGEVSYEDIDVTYLDISEEIGSYALGFNPRILSRNGWEDVDEFCKKVALKYTNAI